MLDVIRSMGWKRISLIYDIDTLGWAGTKEFNVPCERRSCQRDIAFTPFVLML